MPLSGLYSRSKGVYAVITTRQFCILSAVSSIEELSPVCTEYRSSNFRLQLNVRTHAKRLLVPQYCKVINGAVGGPSTPILKTGKMKVQKRAESLSLNALGAD